MSTRPIPPRFVGSAVLPPNEVKRIADWGPYVCYIEFADDGFPLRQIHVHANGNAVAYDRAHWDDRFGSLGDFRFGELWIAHWGQPEAVTEATFEAYWAQAEAMRERLDAPRSDKGPPIWITFFESGRWSGQP